jgi:hypothetical protein
VVSAATRLHCHHAAWQLHGQLDQAVSAQPSTEHNPSCLIQTHSTAAVLSQVDPQYCDLHRPLSFL